MRDNRSQPAAGVELNDAAGMDPGVNRQDPSGRYKNYLLGVLLAISAFNFVDRISLGLMLQDIKSDLQLSDLQLGVMSGIAFAIFYSLMGIPIARWADRGDRVRIIWLTTALWSGAVALCGVAASFFQLLFIRIFVGIGEAGCGPPAQSLIANYFPRAERPRAAATYSLGAPLGKVIGYFVAGWLNQFYGWRTTFILLGIPGLLLAVVARFSLKEPRRNVVSSDADRSAESIANLAERGGELSQPTLRDAVSTLWGNNSFRSLLLGFAILNFFIFGVTQWQPAFFVRSYGIGTGMLGTWFAVIFGGAGLLGVYAGGKWASRYPHREELHLKICAAVYGILALVSPFIYITEASSIAFVALAVAAFGYYVTFGPAIAAIQTLVPDRMRATAFAFLYLFVNLIGIGLGPLAVGALSDWFAPWAGKDSLRYALLLLSPGYVWAAWHIWQASKTVAQDLEHAYAEDAAARGRAVVSGAPVRANV